MAGTGAVALVAVVVCSGTVLVGHLVAEAAGVSLVARPGSRVPELTKPDATRFVGCNIRVIVGVDNRSKTARLRNKSNLSHVPQTVWQGAAGDEPPGLPQNVRAEALRGAAVAFRAGAGLQWR